VNDEQEQKKQADRPEQDQIDQRGLGARLKRQELRLGKDEL
jgi:hypothetical protein